MSVGALGAIITLVIFIAFLVIWVGVIPAQYNKGIEQKQTHTSFCSDLHTQLINSQNDIRLQNLTIEYSKEYQQSCS